MKTKLNSSKKRPQAGRTRALAVAPRSAFLAGTGLLGATESGQRVTKENAHLLPPGSVVRLDDGGRLIHLHDELWLWCNDCAWCYDGIDRHAHRLPGTLCHLPPNAETSRASTNPHEKP